MRRLSILTLFIIATLSVAAMDLRSMIVDYYSKCPQEKIFVHTDKDQYVAGDTVWFRAHLIDAMTMQEKSESRYVYIELYDESMTMLERHMVRSDSVGVFANALRLSSKYTTGAYTLMAYTQWMQNFPSKRFFYKRITIADKEATTMPQKDDEATYVSDSKEPKPASDITMSQRNELLHIQYAPSQRTDNDALSLAIYGSGNIIIVDTLTDAPVTFRQLELCPGTVNIAVVNSRTGKVVAERLAFIKGAGLPEVSATITSSDRCNTLDIDVRNILGTPLTGNFSISVTDADVVKKDSTQQDIASYLLAGAELTPLDKELTRRWSMNSMSDIVKLDNLVSQQAEQRFSLAEIMSGKTKAMTYGIQRDQRISGTVRGTLRKKIKTPQIIVLNPAEGTLERYDLPSSAHFNLTDMNIPEGASFMLEATRHNGSNSLVELKLDEQTFPLPYVVRPKANRRIMTDDFLKYERMQAVINGLNDMNYLEELEVEGHMRSADETRKSFEPRKTYDKARDGETRYRDMKSWLMSMGYLILPPKRDIERAELIGPTIYVDGFRTDLSEVLTISPVNVKSINGYLERNGVMSLPSSLPSAYDNAKGFLYIELENAKRHASDNPLAIKTIQPLGYMLPVSADGFSMPREEGQIDMRTTLFWSPYVKLSEEGRASVKFYSSDNSKRYRVTIQGVSDNGQMISKEIEL